MKSVNFETHLLEHMSKIFMLKSYNTRTKALINKVVPTFILNTETWGPEN